MPDTQVPPEKRLVYDAEYMRNIGDMLVKKWGQSLFFVPVPNAFYICTRAREGQAPKLRFRACPQRFGGGESYLVCDEEYMRNNGDMLVK